MRLCTWRHSLLGLRREQVLVLTWDDIDVVVRIRRILAYADGPIRSRQRGPSFALPGMGDVDDVLRRRPTPV
jgi:hypothetical protein